MRIFAATVALLTLASCPFASQKGGPQPMQSVGLKDGSAKFKVPSAWSVLLSSDEKSNEKWKQRAQHDSSVASMMAVLDNPVIKAAAVDLRKEKMTAKFADNVNVVATPGAPRSDARRDLERGVKEIKAMPWKNGVATEIVTLKSGPALHYTGILKGTGGQGNDLIGYVLPRNGTYFTITFSTAMGQAKSKQSLARAIADSFVAK